MSARVTGFFLAWHELGEDDRNIIHERIANGELPHDFDVTEHVYYVGPDAGIPYLHPAPLGPR